MRWWTSLALWCLVFIVISFILRKTGLSEFMNGALTAIIAIQVQEFIENK